MGGAVSNSTASSQIGAPNPAAGLIPIPVVRTTRPQENQLNDNVQQPPRTNFRTHIPTNSLGTTSAAPRVVRIDNSYDMGGIRHQSYTHGQMASMSRAMIDSRTADRDTMQYMGMSLGMNQEELLFNMIYFGGLENGQNTDFGNVLNSVVDETIAAHSENNTPYKLKPIPTEVLEHLNSETLDNMDSVEERECSVCKDYFEIGSKVIHLKKCNHRFHKDCLVHWLRMQNVCPICRWPLNEISDVSSPMKDTGTLFTKNLALDFEPTTIHDTAASICTPFVNSVLAEGIRRRIAMEREAD